MRPLFPALALCLSAPLASGDIVYTDIPDIVLSATDPEDIASMSLDINGDGTDDLTLVAAGELEVLPGFTYGPVTYTEGLAGTGFIGERLDIIPPHVDATPLPLGHSIDSRYGYWDEAIFEHDSYDGWSDEGGYVGVEFAIAGQFHYAWARVASVRDHNTWTATLTVLDFAYESTPGAAIPAGAVPAPGALALLAFGAAGLAARPRRKS